MKIRKEKQISETFLISSLYVRHEISQRKFGDSLLAIFNKNKSSYQTRLIT